MADDDCVYYATGKQRIGEKEWTKTARFYREKCIAGPIEKPPWKT
jgi:hypothetical protein